ncbi:hypothetical protein B0H13DRAFT_2081404, partial [Mycena leptocephala]
VSLWIWVGSVRALGRLWGRASAGAGQQPKMSSQAAWSSGQAVAAGEYVFVGSVALRAGRLVGPSGRSIQDETKKT